MKKLLYCLPLVGSFLLAGCSTIHRHQTLEYRVIQGVPRQEEFQHKLNAAAAEGYVIDSSTFVPGDERTQHQMVIILRRRKP